MFFILYFSLFNLEKSFGIKDKSKETLLIFFLKEKKDNTNDIYYNIMKKTC